jgi:hypothetical protein
MIALQKRRLLIAGREILPDFGQWPARSLVVGPAPGGHHARTGVSASAHPGRQDDTRSAGDRRVTSAYVDWDGAGDVESSQLGCSCDCSTTISENLLRARLSVAERSRLGDRLLSRPRLQSFLARLDTLHV